MFELNTNAPKANEGAGRKITVQVNLADNLEALIADLGVDSVFSAAMAQYRVDAQAVVRGMLEDGKTDAEINERIASWKPGVKVSREAKAAKPLTMDAVLAYFQGLSPEQQEVYLQAMQAKAAVATGAPTPGTIAS